MVDHDVFRGGSAECGVQSEQQVGHAFRFPADQGHAPFFSDSGERSAPDRQDFTDSDLTTGRIEQGLDVLEAAVAERRELAAMIGTMPGKWKQWEWLGWTGITAFILGLLISPMLARVLPFGWDGQIAAFIMNADRWDAGSALMKAQSPEAWDVLVAAGKLAAGNSAALMACREAAAKTKKEQRCSIVVPAL